MSEYCIVAPTRICYALRDRDALGSHHLLLAHDVYQDRNNYRELFQYNGGTLILDNSVAEHGSSVSLDVITGAATAVNPDVTVLPDVYLDGPATTKSCLEALDPWARKFVSAGVKPNFLVIPQGKTFEEFARCAESMAEPDPRITWWGVPRNIVQFIGSRYLCIKLVRMLNPNRKIHLMGFSDNLADDLMCARMPEVDTIDSAVPVRVNVPLMFDTQPGKRGDWWEKGVLTSQNIENIQRIRRICKGYGF